MLNFKGLTGIKLADHRIVLVERGPLIKVSHPGGSSNIPSRFIATETGVKRRPDGPLGSYADFTLPTCSRE